MKIRPVFMRGAFWIGVHWDFDQRRVHVMPLPYLGIRIQLAAPPRQPSTEAQIAARTLRQLARVLRRKSRDSAVISSPHDVSLIIATIQVTQSLLADNLDAAADQMENSGD